ncbi:hypothetical protein R6Q59_035967 [Mikania micrantha]
MAYKGDVLDIMSGLDLSCNKLTGNIPQELGNPLLRGIPLENECTMESHRTQPSNEEGNDEKWNDMDMASFYGSCSSTLFIFMLGFLVVLYVNHYWRRWWFHLVDERAFDLGPDFPLPAPPLSPSTSLVVPTIATAGYCSTTATDSAAISFLLSFILFCSS